MLSPFAFTEQETPKEAALRNLTGEIHIDHFERWLDNKIYPNALADFVEGVKHLGLGQTNTLAGPAKHLLGAIPDLCEQNKYLTAIKCLVASATVLRSREYEVRKLNNLGKTIVNSVEENVKAILKKTKGTVDIKDNLMTAFIYSDREDYKAFYEAIRDTGELPENLPDLAS